MAKLIILKTDDTYFGGIVLYKSCKPLLRLTALALAAIWCLLPSLALAKSKQPAAPPAPVKVTVLATAGVNGQIINWDYQFPRTAEFGLVRIASLVKKERQNNPYTLLVDGGNMLSGSALTNYFAQETTKLPIPMVTMYNALGYDAMVLGDGEFDYGPAYLSKALTLAKFPVLAANTSSADKTWAKIKPYTIKEFDVGKEKKKKEFIRIGINGISAMDAQTDPQSHTGLTFTDQAAAIAAATKKLQKSVDAIIVVKNNGLEVNGVAAAVPGKFGSSLSKTDLTFEKIGKKWVVTQTDTSSIFAVTAPPDKAMTDAAWPYHDATLQHLAKRP